MSNRLSFVACILCLLLVVSRAFGGQVVLLHSKEAPSPWTESLQKGVGETLGAAVPLVSFYLGVPSAGDDYFDSMAVSIAADLGGPPAAVVADGELAFGFVRKYRETVFPGASVVYCGMPRPSEELLAQCECTGVAMPDSVAQTVDLIFTLQPETSMVVGMMDGLPDKRLIRAEVEQAMEQYVDRAKLLFPGHEPGDDGGLDLDMVRTVASSVPVGGSVLLLGLDVDNREDVLSKKEVVQTLASRTDAPVFVLDPAWVRDGVLGSVGVRGEDHGQQVARIVRRALDGEAAKDILPETTSPRVVVDLTVMTRFGIERAQLPDGSIGLNTPPRQLSEEVVALAVDHWFFVVAVMAFVCVALVIVTLVRRRSRAL